MKKIGTLVVIGVGLIGGSFALALKKQKAVARVIGVDRSRANLNAAKQLRIIDEVATDVAKAVANADLVFVAVPPLQIPKVLAQIAPHLGARTVVTDAGSTKQDVIAAARVALGAAFSRFVPAHPIAGTENSGAQAAFATLYQGRHLIVTPTEETDKRALRLVTSAWRMVGAKIINMRADEHDRVFALVSHLPHLISFALVGQIADEPDAKSLFAHSGGGFRDVSRIAASSPEMWRDVVLANRDAVLPALNNYLREAQTLRDLIAAGDSAQLETYFARARVARRRWLKDK